MGFSWLQVISAIGRFLTFMIVIRLLIECVIAYTEGSMRKNNMIGFLYDITEPFIKPFRRILPPSVIIDSSPIFAIAMIQVCTMLVLNILSTLGVP